MFLLFFPLVPFNIGVPSALLWSFCLESLHILSNCLDCSCPWSYALARPIQGAGEGSKPLPRPLLYSTLPFQDQLYLKAFSWSNPHLNSYVPHCLTVLSKAYYTIQVQQVQCSHCSAAQAAHSSSDANECRTVGEPAFTVTVLLSALPSAHSPVHTSVPMALSSHTPSAV